MHLDTRGQLAPSHRERYILGGDATFTLQSCELANRFTYRITRKEIDATRSIWFVAVLTGPDNWSNYKYAGLFDPQTKTIRQTTKSKIALNAPSMVALQWALAHLDSDKFEFWHEGSCGICGRKLTVPESIASGIGPTCANK
jgi:hypothetical protein